MSKEPLLPPRDWSTFEGVDTPHYTQTPDELFDSIMQYLTGAELKVLLYIVRRTLGFKQSTDDIGIDQLCHGIKTRDGRQLDFGTGLARTTVLEALRSLKEKNLIVVEQRMDDRTGSKPSRYALNVRGGVRQSAPGGTPERAEGVRQDVPREYAQAHPQETAFQETVQETVPPTPIRDSKYNRGRCAVCPIHEVQTCGCDALKAARRG